jgi:hypothetical protein
VTICLLQIETLIIKSTASLIFPHAMGLVTDSHISYLSNRTLFQFFLIENNCFDFCFLNYILGFWQGCGLNSCLTFLFAYIRL